MEQNASSQSQSIQKINTNNKGEIIGLLLDVSGSMRNKFENLSKENIEFERIESVYDTFLNLFENNITFKENSYVFAILFGKQTESLADFCQIFKNIVEDCISPIFLTLKDLFTRGKFRKAEELAFLISKNKNLSKLLFELLKKNEFMEKFRNSVPSIFKYDENQNNFSYKNKLTILLQNRGCDSIEYYISEYIEEDDAKDIFLTIENEEDLISQIIKVLPYEYRPNTSNIYVNTSDIFGIISNMFVNGSVSMYCSIKKKTNRVAPKKIESSTVKKCRDKAIEIITQKTSSLLTNIVLSLIEDEIKHNEKLLKKFKAENYDFNFNGEINIFRSSNKISIHNCKDILNIVKKIADKNDEMKELKSNVSGLMNKYFFSNTPMLEAFKSSSELFREPKDINKFLMVLSDGEPTDGDPLYIADELKKSGTIISCVFISDEQSFSSNPRQLYDYPSITKSKGENLMYSMSSMIENEYSLMSTLLQDEGWIIPSSGKFKLFLHGNHPEIIREFNKCLKYLYHHDALINLIGKVKLTDYINSTNTGFIPVNQVGGTCYAHAVATVIHLSLNRIHGREIPEFQELKDEIIKDYGSDGAKTEKVLKEKCTEYKLKYQIVNEERARKALFRNRPVVARFHLYDEEWKAFDTFYKKNPTGILKSEYIDVTCDKNKKKKGHAVVLMRCDSESLTFLNSWGPNWANKGFFKIKNEKVLNLEFFDVFWTLDQLSAEEIQAYEDYKIQKSKIFLGNIKNLKYKCQICLKPSKIEDYSTENDVCQVICPLCKSKFNPKIGRDAEEILRHIYKKTLI